MNNYAVMVNDAKKRFCTYNVEIIAAKNGVSHTDTHIITTFLGETARIEKATGNVTVGSREAVFGEILTLFDWLCDGKPDTAASYDFCPVTSLPGIFVAGKGLTLNGDRLADTIDKNPEKFCAACKALGGTEIKAGDIGFQLMALPGLPMQLKFYHSDEEFPATLTLLWDKNILQFIRYETVYYLAGCLLARLATLL